MTTSTFVCKFDDLYPKYIDDMIKNSPSLSMNQLSTILDYGKYFKNSKLLEKKSNIFVRVGRTNVLTEQPIPINAKDLINNVCMSCFTTPTNDPDVVCDVYKAICEFYINRKVNMSITNVNCHNIKGISPKFGSYEGLFPDALFDQWKNVND